MMPRFRYIAILLFMALVLPQFAGAVLNTQPMLQVQAKFGSIPLLPYLDYYLDESGSMDVEEIASRELSDSFSAFSMEKLPAATGVLWLRFTLAPVSPPERSPVLLLDIGPCAPGIPTLYGPEKNELSGALEWRETYPGNRNIMLLPEAGQEPVPCYLRLDGLPGLWFGPTVRTPQDAASNWGSLALSGAVLALGVVMFLCLLRGLSERGQWRIWTALYVFFALLQAFAGLPSQIGNPGLPGLCAILSPGIALMLLPHVGRHLLRTQQNSRALDIQLLLLSLPGAVCALVPLVPGWNWLDRWLELWPLAMLIFVPTALAAWLMGLAGSRRFLLACLLPPIFTGAGILGLYFGIPSNLLASAPLWGVALSALLLAATRAPHYGGAARENTEEEKNAPNAPNGEIINLETPLDDGGLKLEPDWPEPKCHGDLILPNLGPAKRPDSDAAALEDPNLRLIPGEHAQEDSGPAGAPAPLAGQIDEKREEALRAPLDEIMREGAALDNCALPPAARKFAENMLTAAHRMAEIISGAPIVPNQAPKHSLVNFNLQHLLRDAHDAVAPAAENAGIGLGWYMPPALPQLYRGVCGNLGDILRLLLESSVRATNSGSVHLSVRHVPESPDPGHILFTITDSGSGFPPSKRSSVALDRAWELVGAHNGHISLECGAQGTTISFSLHFTPLEDEKETGPALPRVAVLCENSERRREIARMLAPLDLRISESAAPEELLRHQDEDPAGVLIVAGRMAAPAASDMLREFVARAREAGFGTCKILAVHSDNSQDSLLAASGFTHAIPEPLDTAELRSTVLDLVEYVSADYAPVAKAGSPQARPDNMEDIQKTVVDLDWEEDERQPVLSEEPRESLPDWLETARPSVDEVPDRPILPDAIWQEADEAPAAEQPIFTEEEFEKVFAPEAGQKERPAQDVAPGAVDAVTTESAPQAPVATIVVEPEPVPEGRPEEKSAVEEEPAGTETVVETRAGKAKNIQAEGVDSTEPESGDGGAAGKAQAQGPADEREIAAGEIAAAQPAAENKIEDAAAEATAPGEQATGIEDVAAEVPTKARANDIPQPAGQAMPEPVEQPVPEVEQPATESVSAVREEPGENDSDVAQPEPVSTKPETDNRERHVPKTAKTQGSTAKPYISPWIGMSGEWVGEPTPIVKKPEDSENSAGQEKKLERIAGTAARSADSPAAKSTTGEEESNKGKTEGENAGPERRRPGKPRPAVRSGLNQAPVQVEWVGEPMPIQPKNRAGANEPAEEARNAASHADAGFGKGAGHASGNHAENGSRLAAHPGQGGKHQAIPVSPQAESGVYPVQDKQESNNLIADFMSKTISQVSSTLERLTRGGKAGEKPAKPFEQSLAARPAAAPQGARPQPAANHGAAKAHPVEQKIGQAPEPVREEPRIDPAILRLVDELDLAIEDAKKAFAMRNCQAVADCATRISEESDKFGLRVLSRMAMCVVRAGRHGDLQAVSDLLPDLVAAVERNKVTLTQIK